MTQRSAVRQAVPVVKVPGIHEKEVRPSRDCLGLYVLDERHEFAKVARVVRLGKRRLLVAYSDETESKHETWATAPSSHP